MKGEMSVIPKKDVLYTYEDYLKWDTEDTYELIEGIPYLLAAPSREHQKISMNLSTDFNNYFRDKDCEVYAAPFEVVLVKDNEVDNKSKNVVQPDISVICDKSKLNDRGCLGSPTLIVEIISPSTTSLDYVKKLNLYQDHKVLEYWIINPKSRTVQVFKLINDQYNETEIYMDNDTIQVAIFPGLSIDLKRIFWKINSAG